MGKTKCGHGSSCPVKHEHQHRMEFWHSDDEDVLEKERMIKKKRPFAGVGAGHSTGTVVHALGGRGGESNSRKSKAIRPRSDKTKRKAFAEAAESRSTEESNSRETSRTVSTSKEKKRRKKKADVISLLDSDSAGEASSPRKNDKKMPEIQIIESSDSEGDILATPITKPLTKPTQNRETDEQMAIRLAAELAEDHLRGGRDNGFIFENDDDEEFIPPDLTNGKKSKYVPAVNGAAPMNNFYEFNANPDLAPIIGSNLNSTQRALIESRIAEDKREREAHELKRAINTSKHEEILNQDSEYQKALAADRAASAKKKEEEERQKEENMLQKVIEESSKSFEQETYEKKQQRHTESKLKLKEEPKEGEACVTIAFKLPANLGGGRKVRRFACDQNPTVGDCYTFIRSLKEILNLDRWQLETTFPTRQLDEEVRFSIKAIKPEENEQTEETPARMPNPASPGLATFVFLTNSHLTSHRQTQINHCGNSDLFPVGCLL